MPDHPRESRFDLLASAIAGRAVDVAPAEVGSPAWTDGATILVDAALDRRDRLRCTTVQAALLAAGSLEPDVMRSLARRPALARRYLAIEGHRALVEVEHLLPVAVRGLADHEIAASTDSPETSLAIAKHSAQPEPPDAFGTIRPKLVGPASASVEQTTSHAPARTRQEVLAELDDEHDDDTLSLDLISSPVGGGGGMGKLLKRLFGDARSEGSGPPGADAPTHGSRGSTRVARTSAVITATSPAFEEAQIGRSPGATYPEWDVFARRYRPEWCTVVEGPPPSEEGAEIMPAGAQALRRALARLGMELERRHRQLQGDDVDIDATVEAFVQVAAGSPPDEAIYVDSLRCRRDLSVLVLLDISGSAGKPAATSGSVHEHQRAAAAALMAALHDLGDRVALHAFRSQGRGAVEVLPVKRFDEPLDAKVQRRLGGLVPGAYTRLGAAIRHGTALLERDGGTSRRLLVVLSDGFAYDHGYEGAYGEADARRALAEARRRGVACLCLSIAAGTDADVLRRVFGTAAHARIPRGDKLPDVVGPLFRAALRSAELQRRAWQRAERTRERLQIDTAASKTPRRRSGRPGGRMGDERPGTPAPSGDGRDR